MLRAPQEHPKITDRTCESRGWHGFPETLGKPNHDAMRPTETHEHAHPARANTILARSRKSANQQHTRKFLESTQQKRNEDNHRITVLAHSRKAEHRTDQKWSPKWSKNGGPDRQFLEGGSPSGGGDKGTDNSEIGHV